MAKEDPKPAVDNDESSSDFWKTMKEEDKHDRASSRLVAAHQFAHAREFAKSKGFELIQHSEVHYKIKTPHWTFEVYPGNGRIWTNDRSAPILIRRMPVCWNLLDVVAAVAKELEKMPKPGEQNDDASLSEAMRQFKNASIMAAAHHFRLSRQGNVFKVIAHGWSLELHPESQQIVRVDDKGPHLEFEGKWTLMDVVKAIIKKMEK